RLPQARRRLLRRRSQRVRERMLSLRARQRRGPTSRSICRPWRGKLKDGSSDSRKICSIRQGRRKRSRRNQFARAQRWDGTILVLAGLAKNTRNATGRTRSAAEAHPFSGEISPTRHLSVSAEASVAGVEKPQA